MRQIVLDTETTGLEPKQGHRIIEIGCVEMVDRKLTGNHYHMYINPGRHVDDGAIAVHGLTNEFLADKPKFAEVYQDFFNFIKGAQLIIHNAPFDTGFINHEFKLHDRFHKPVNRYCEVIDSLVIARQKHPGQRNNLDALCQRYHIDNSNRELHGALLDAQLLAQVYLLMTGGQTAMFASEKNQTIKTANSDIEIRRLADDRLPLKVIAANADEVAVDEGYFVSE